MITLDTVRPGMGKAPAVVGIDTKYGRNAAGMLRCCSAYGIGQLWLTGNRWAEEFDRRGRLPREERMKAYSDVDVYRCDKPLLAFGPGVTPVGVEVMDSAEPLAWFQHPENPVYVFGPEDGSLPAGIRAACHRFLILPTGQCLNLASAVAVVLNDRKVQRQRAGLEPVLPASQTAAGRGWLDSDDALKWSA